MSHRTNLISLLGIVAFGLLVAAGCDRTNGGKPSTQKQQQKLTPEQQAARDLQKSNQAATDVGKKLGRKLEPMDIGVPIDTKTNQAPPATPKQ